MWRDGISLRGLDGAAVANLMGQMVAAVWGQGVWLGLCYGALAGMAFLLFGAVLGAIVGAICGAGIGGVLGAIGGPAVGAVFAAIVRPRHGYLPLPQDFRAWSRRALPAATWGVYFAGGMLVVVALDVKNRLPFSVSDTYIPFVLSGLTALAGLHAAGRVADWYDRAIASLLASGVPVHGVAPVGEAETEAEGVWPPAPRRREG